MGDVNAVIQSNLAVAFAAVAVLGLALVVVALVQARRVRRLQRRLEAITRGEDGDSLQAVLEAHLNRVVEVDREVDELAARTALLESAQRRAFQRLGLVRYNPFDDTGGNQSFALAVLDGDEHGFVISSLHARSGTRLYAKSLSHGQAEGALSAEEQQALVLARNASMGRAPISTTPARGRPAPVGRS